MNIEQMSAGHKRNSRRPRLKLATLLFLVPFLMMLNPPSMLGQGFKMTKLNPFNSTTPFPVAVNTGGSVVGDYVDSSGNTQGFLYVGGKYTSLDYQGATFMRAVGINDSNEVVGDFFGSDNFYHGYTYVNGTYTQYDVDKGVVSTSLFGINNAGDLVGSYVPTSTGVEEGFIAVGGGPPTATFYGSGTDPTYAYGINISDEVVGQYIDSSGISHGFYRDASGTITEVAYPGATQTGCYGINDSGEITGYYVDSSGHTHGFTDKGGAFATTDFPLTTGVNSKGAYVGYYYAPQQAYGYLASPQAFKLSEIKTIKEQQVFVRGLNNAGVFVGQYVTNKGVTHGMMVSGGKVTNIDDPKGATTDCFDINSSNEIVGAYYDSGGTSHGFQYSGKKFKDVPGPAGATASFATGINDAGDIAGGFWDSAGNAHGFILKGGKYTQLDVPGATGTFAWGINTAGEVTVEWYDSSGYTESSLYNGKKYSSIDVPGAFYTEAHSINTAGDIVFIATDVYGNTHGALKKGNSYFIFDYPKGSNTGSAGINDSDLLVGHYIPSGQTYFQSYQGTE